MSASTAAVDPALADTIGGYYTPLSSFFEQGNQDRFARHNIFAIILGFTTPRPCRGSHKYSLSFTVMDSSLPSVAKGIQLIWFTNDVNGLDMQFRVGDALRCENLHMEVFNNFPQLLGRRESASMNIFQYRERYLSGLPMPTPPSSGAGDEDPDHAHPRDTDPLRPDGASSSRPFCDAQWKVVTIGVDVCAEKKKKSKKKKPKHKAQQAQQREEEKEKEEEQEPPPPPPRKTLMWVQEEDKLRALQRWGKELLLSTSLAEGVGGHYSLHAVQSHLHSTAGCGNYAHLAPHALLALPAAAPMPAQQLAGQEAQEQPLDSLVAYGKCDVVCLVVALLPPQTADGLAKMAVWDGSTNGFYVAGAEAARKVFLALRAASEYGAEDDEEASERIALLEQQLGLSGNNESSSMEPSYLGSAVLVSASSAVQNLLISRCRVGMWVRIRNLHAFCMGLVPLPQQGQPAAPAPPRMEATVNADSYVCQLSPYCKDAARVARAYLQRLSIVSLQEDTPRRSPPQIQAAAGPITALYCVQVRVDDFWPRRTSDLLTTGASRSRARRKGAAEMRLMFVLKVSDASGYCHVEFHDEEAERFLGVSAAQLANSASEQAAAQQRLTACTERRAPFSVNLRVYSAKERVSEQADLPRKTRQSAASNATDNAPFLFTR
ncbi:hypothetical protein B484DRAFT_399659 [Ochromonadaceae sp. CCMP2298]|nr:hypothetical protein B484DRAFT_399659 [Ochromonadaceae sp. CCMP2298]